MVSYVYDSKSRLLQRVEGGTTTNYTWDGWNLIKEVKTGAISESTDYLLPANAFERGGDWYYMHGDALSSTQLATDENGDQVARFIYGAWGEELYASESVPGILENRFVGGLGCRKDVATGLVYMRNRWYDPALQRFISRDPIGLKGGENLYSYAENQPTNYIDPLGQKGAPSGSSCGPPPDCERKRTQCNNTVADTHESLEDKIDIAEIGRRIAMKAQQYEIVAAIEVQIILMETWSETYFLGNTLNCKACYELCLYAGNPCGLGWLPSRIKGLPLEYMGTPWPKDPLN